MKRLLAFALLLAPITAKAADAPCYQWGPDNGCIAQVVPLVPTGNPLAPFAVPGTTANPTIVTVTNPTTGGGTTTASPAPTTNAQQGLALTVAAGTFAQVVASDTTRKSCRIDNPTAADTMYVYVGTSQTPSATNSRAILPGNPFRCDDNGTGTVMTDAIAIAFKSTANAPYILSVGH